MFFTFCFYKFTSFSDVVYNWSITVAPYCYTPYSHWFNYGEKQGCIFLRFKGKLHIFPFQRKYTNLLRENIIFKRGWGGVICQKMYTPEEKV